MKPLKNSKFQLLVEGKDDQNSVIHLMGRHGVSFDIQGIFVRDFEGIGNLLTHLPQILKTSDLTALGIIIDSDEDPKARWASLRQRIPELPRECDEAGTIVELLNGRLALGVWMMPDNASKGMLEDFLAYLVPVQTQPLWDFAKASSSSALNDYGAPCPLKDQSKAEIYTWLAWQAEPGRPLGLAIKAGFLSGSNPKVADFVDWFRRLYQIPVE